MRWFRFAVLVLTATVLQAGLLANLNTRPDLLLVLLVFFAINCDPTEVIISSFSIGFAADIVSASMGPRMISFGLLGTMLAYLHRVITIKKMPYQGLAIFISGLAVGIAVNLLNLLKSGPVASVAYSTLFGISICSGVVGPFLFLPSAWWMSFKTSRSTRRQS
jgi:rod shape-determining protein MreD